MKSLLTLISFLLFGLVFALCIAYSISGWLVLAMVVAPGAFLAPRPANTRDAERR